MIQKPNSAVLDLIESKRDFCLGCEKIAIKNKEKATANLFKYQAKMCQELISIIEVWKEGDRVEIKEPVQPSFFLEVVEKHKREHDKELMNPDCAGELGVWNK